MINDILKAIRKTLEEIDFFDREAITELAIIVYLLSVAHVLLKKVLKVKLIERSEIK